MNLPSPEPTLRLGPQAIEFEDRDRPSRPVIALILGALLIGLLARCAPPPPPMPPPHPDTLAVFTGALQASAEACPATLDLTVTLTGEIRFRCERPVLPVPRAKLPAAPKVEAGP